MSRVGEAFVAALLDAMPTPQARMLLTARLAQYSGQTIYIPSPSKSARRTIAARHMINSGDMTDAEIATALHERFRVSLRQAQRDVSRARQMSQEYGGFAGSTTNSGAENQASNPQQKGNKNGLLETPS